MKNIFIDSVANCGYRLLDYQKYCNYFLKNGYNIVYNAKKADYIILITCGFSNSASDASINRIKKLKQYNAELIVAGCLPSILPESVSNHFKGKIISTKDLNQNSDKIDTIFPGIKIKMKDIQDSNIIEIKNDKIDAYNSFRRRISILENGLSPGNLFKILLFSTPIKIRKHVFDNLFGQNSVIHHHFTQFVSDSVCSIRIGWGCSSNCSYCSIKKAIGPSLSKPLDQCLNDFTDAIYKGYKDIYLFSPDTGSYGIDISSNLPGLMDEVTNIPGNYKIFLASVNPVWVVKYVKNLEKIVSKGKIRYMELPIQSGSSRILKLMNRYSDVSKIKESYNRLQKSCQDLNLYLHIIIGFPTETDEDFNETLSFIKDMNIKGGRVFICSCMEGTKAAEIEPKITEDVLLKRKKEFKKYLLKLGYKTIWPGGFGIFYKK